MAAKVNLNTGKIVGCKKHSFAWWHEKGHIIYDDSEQGITNGYRKEMCLLWALSFLIPSIYIKSLALFSFIFMGFFWYYFWYEEAWCDAYAKSKLKTFKRGKNL